MTRLQRRVQTRQAVSHLIDTGEARRIRQAARVSLNEIAEEVGVALTTVHHWETGRKRPRDEHATKYLRVLENLASIPGAAA